MKVTLAQPGSARHVRAISLPEMMISVAVFSMLLLGLISVNLFCLRQDELVNSKLGANDSSRLAFDLMLNEIRGCKAVQIGSGWHTNFVPITNGLQQGDTIQIASGTNSNIFVYYYFDTNVLDTNYNCLVRIASTNNGIVTNYYTNVVCSSLTNMPSQWATNALTFQALDYTGTNVLTNDPATVSNYNYVVGFLLQFSQLQYPPTKIGPSNFFNYYQIQFQAARRSPTL